MIGDPAGYNHNGYAVKGVATPLRNQSLTIFADADIVFRKVFSEHFSGILKSFMGNSHDVQEAHPYRRRHARKLPLPFLHELRCKHYF